MVLSAAFDWRQTFNKYNTKQQRNVLPRIKLRVADDDTPQLFKETHQKIWCNVKVGNFGIFSENKVFCMRHPNFIVKVLNCK